MPADGAAVSADDDAPVPAGVHRPNLVPTRLPPFLRSGVVERHEGEARAKEKALGVTSNCKASRALMSVKRKRSSFERGAGTAPPTVDRQAFTVRRERQFIVRRRTG
jgi:hypothetical protein